SSDAGHYALGFRSDGSAFIDRPQLKTAMTLGGEKYRLGGINKTAEKGDFYLFTGDFGPVTSVQGAMRNLIVSCPDELGVNCELELTVEDQFDSAGAIEIPEGKMVIALTADSDEWRQYGYDSVSIGDSFMLTIGADEEWNECVSAVGSLYKLVTDGRVEEELDKKDASAAPRTAVGIMEDGTVLFYTVDGRQSGYSKGISLRETAERLVQLGCVEAGAMDGGASTNMQAVIAGDRDLSAINRPSLGREREVSCYILLVAKNAGSGETKILSPRQDGTVMLRGSSLALTAGAADETGRAVTPGELSWSADEGEIGEDRLFTAPERPCTVTVTAVADGVSATEQISVIDTPDSMRMVDEKTGRAVSSLALACGETAELSVLSEWRMREVVAADADYVWTVRGGIGEISEDGLFTASENGGVGLISAAAGDCIASVEVRVQNSVTTVRDFESAEGLSAVNAVISGEKDVDRVKIGYGSLRADYDLSGGEAVIDLGTERPAAGRNAMMWIYADGSGNRVYTDTGVYVTSLDCIGWRQSVFPAEEGVKALVIEGEGGGTLWFDQMLLSASVIPDNDPPWLSLSFDENVITGSAYDGTDGAIDPGCIMLTVDSQPLEFEYDASDGTLRAYPEESAAVRRIALEAKDRSGNIHRVSLYTDGEQTESFGDISGHWARKDIEYMRLRGVVNGYEREDGGAEFRPDEPVTRAQAAVMLCRWMGVDLSLYADTDTELTDADEIPAWAADSAKAAYALSVIKGVGGEDGVYFRPGDILTRAQAVTMLGRCLEAGSMSADLAFNDAEQVPAWAERYISEFVFKGVINGYEDATLRPGAEVTRAQLCKLLAQLS
ncbi:MAG: S-layer homology domain-containing protein, partial [Oscillospiraceae bacterium]|nr:S-layer homology domain-containing protein [Oscillospiraceae bacterium]